VFEYKGRTVSPRRGDVELLIELGLGIDRRLRSQQPAGQRRLLPEDVSFWYLANHLGRRFLRDAEGLLGALEVLSTGLWRCRLLGRLVFLVSSIDLPVEVDSLPLHIVGKEPVATERLVAQLVAEQPSLQQRYGGWVASLHPEAWKEVEAMARAAGKGLKIDLQAAIDAMGLGRIIDQVGIRRVINQVGLRRVIDEVGIDGVVELLEQEGVIERISVEKFVAKANKKEMIKQIGLDEFVANLSPAERRELKRRLQ
jgi:hypothetical protein